MAFTGSFTNIFGGNVTNAANIPFANVTLTANTQFYWATNFQDSPNIIAAIMDVTPTTGGLHLTLDNATLVSVGQSILISNFGNVSFDIYSFDGANLETVAVGQALYIYLTDNTTTAGVWATTPWGGGYQAVTRVAATSSNNNLTIGGSPITTSGTFTFNLANDLAALTGFGGGTGFAARTAANTWSLRQILGTNNQIAVANSTGVGGDVTLSLATNITGVNSLLVGNLSIAANTISATNLNGNILLDPNGTGATGVNSNLNILAGNVLQMYNAGGTFYTALGSPPGLGANFIYFMPTTAPIANQSLSFGGGTQLIWQTVSNFSGPTTTDAIARYSNTVGNFANSGVLIDNANNITGANSLTVSNFNIATTDANTIGTSAGNIVLSPNGISTVNSTSDIIIETGSQLKLQNTGGNHYVSLQAGVLSANTNFILPIADGVANSLMFTNGSAALGFTSRLVFGIQSAGATFTGSSGNIIASNNINTIVRNSAGTYTVTFTNNMPDNKYTIIATAQPTNTATASTYAKIGYDTKSVSGFKIYTFNTDTVSPALTDMTEVSFQVTSFS